MNGRGPHPSSPGLDDADGFMEEDLPTGAWKAILALPEETQFLAERAYREHRWNHRFLKALATNLKAIKILLYIVLGVCTVGPAVATAAVWLWTHYH